MPQYEHLRLVRLPEQLERRKRPGFGAPVDRGDFRGHSVRIETQLDEAIATQQRRRRPEFVDPALILRVRMTGSLLEVDWDQLGLTVLSSDADRTLVLFSSNDDLVGFRERLHAYGLGIPAGQKNASYAGFVSSIESIGAVEPRDRIGLHLRESGFTEPDDFFGDDEIVLDLELWDLGSRDLRQQKLTEIASIIEGGDGEVYDEYIGPSISMMRFCGPRSLVAELLSVEEIASIDFPPKPDVANELAMDLELGDLPPIEGAGEDVPVIGVLDSGVNVHPLLAGVIVGSIGVPASLGDADDFGHGTRVSGMAVYGDLNAQMESGAFTPFARLCSAKVVNRQGGFDDKKLVPSQMREAITSLHSQYGCRIFVSALCDINHVYDGKKVGPWAATLDELARELNVLIVVAAGNGGLQRNAPLEQAVTHYPKYLVDPGNRLFEPAGAINVISVGAISHGEGIGVNVADDVRVRPITQANQPSPFTRAGPGADGSIKPDLVDYGGTAVFDPVLAQIRNGNNLPSAGVLTLHHRHVEKLFRTGAGTSYSTPMVASKASQLLRVLPGASANLLRALMIGSAVVPDAAKDVVAPLGDDALLSLCGYGQLDVNRAAFSDSARVVLYAEDELPLDHFAVYEVPIPAEYQATGGTRSIRVTLAFDPPVRHTRSDYAGVGMSFRLLRGCDQDFVFEWAKKRTKEQGKPPELKASLDCKMQPSSTVRERSSVQSAVIEFKTDVSKYGDVYYLVVRCESGWAEHQVTHQRYAVVVQLEHKANIQMYERLRVKLPA